MNYSFRNVTQIRKCGHGGSARARAGLRAAPCAMVCAALLLLAPGRVWAQADAGPMPGGAAAVDSGAASQSPGSSASRRNRSHGRRCGRRESVRRRSGDGGGVAGDDPGFECEIGGGAGGVGRSPAARGARAENCGAGFCTWDNQWRPFGAWVAVNFVRGVGRAAAGRSR